MAGNWCRAAHPAVRRRRSRRILCLGATGTDTGGSIRQPAAFCGIVGLKPTCRRCSRWGIVAFASSLDQAGPMARTVRRAIMLRVMAGYDLRDSTSMPLPVPDFEATIGGDVNGLAGRHPARIPDRRHGRRDRSAGNGSGMAARRRAEIIEVSAAAHPLRSRHLLHHRAGGGVLQPGPLRRRTLRPARGGRHARRDVPEHRGEGFGAEVRRRILIGTYVLSAGYYDAYYLKAQKVRALIARDFTQAFKQVDVILTPTAPSDAFAIGDKTDDPITMYLNDVFTVPTSLAGLPAISVPAGLSARGLPLGLQLIGRPFDEETVLARQPRWNTRRGSTAGLADRQTRAPDSFMSERCNRLPGLPTRRRSIWQVLDRHARLLLTMTGRGKSCAVFIIRRCERSDPALLSPVCPTRCDDFADLLVRLHVAVRLDDLVEGNTLADLRFQRAFGQSALDEGDAARQPFGIAGDLEERVAAQREAAR